MNKKPWNFLLLYLNFILLALPLATFAHPYCSVRTFSIRDGLASNIISRIAQTGNGIMWFATWNGLCCYDGYRFSAYRNVNAEEHVPVNNRLVTIKGNARGNIWCINHNYNLYLFNIRGSEFIGAKGSLAGRRFSPYSLRTLTNGVSWMEMADEGDLMFCINDSLFAISGGEGAVTEYSKKRLGISGAKMLDVRLDSKGKTWVMTSKGLLLTGDGGQKVYHGGFRFMRENGYGVFFATEEGRLTMFQERGKILKDIKLCPPHPRHDGIWRGCAVTGNGWRHCGV